MNQWVTEEFVEQPLALPGSAKNRTPRTSWTLSFEKKTCLFEGGPVRKTALYEVYCSGWSDL